MNEEQREASGADSLAGCSVESSVAVDRGAAAVAEVKPWRSVGAQRHAGPFDVKCVAVYDGDTMKIQTTEQLRKALWGECYVRLLGCDAPELNDNRAEVRWTAEAAQRKLIEMAACGTLTLENVRLDKYGGRILADVSVDGHDCRIELMRLKYAKAWDGTGARPWS